MCEPMNMADTRLALSDIGAKAADMADTLRRLHRVLYDLERAAIDLGQRIEGLYVELDEQAWV